MRIAHLAFAGAVMALAASTVPALAKSSDAQKAEDKSASSSCSAYQQAPDGAWVQLPCKESDGYGQAQTQHRPAARDSSQEER